MRVAVFIAAAIVMQAAHTVKWGVTDKDNSEEVTAAEKAKAEGSTLEFANCRAIFAKGEADALQKFNEELMKNLDEKLKTPTKSTSKGIEIEQKTLEGNKLLTDVKEGLTTHLEEQANLNVGVEITGQKEETNLNKMMRRILAGNEHTVAIKPTETPGNDNKEEIKVEEQKNVSKVN